MPQLLAIALIGLLVWYAWRALKREMARIGDDVERAKKSQPRKGEVTILEKGEDGVYRPKGE
ncbi:MAG: hypothetical protein WBO55_11280 [Rhizobiaceae bacterium]